MRLPLLLAGLGLFSFSARCQVFEPGLVVTAAGDTVRGEVENSFWEFNPGTVRFRPAPDAPITSYSPQQIRGFQLTGSRYFRTEVLPLDRRAETRTGYLPRGRSSSQQPETVFAEVLVDGPAPLLRFALIGATHYFVRRENQPYLELTESRYTQPDATGRLVIVDGNNYRALLQQFFGDCATAFQAASAARFTAPDLAGVVQAYNQSCSATARPGRSFIAQAKPRQPVAFNAGVVAGAQVQSLKLRVANAPEEAPLLDGKNVASGLHPLAGLYADLLLPNRTLSLHADVSVATVGKSGTLAARGSVPAGEYRWKGTLLSARLGLRYFRPVGSQQSLFAGVGLPLDLTWLRESVLRYGDGQPRQVEGFTVPRTGSFLRRSSSGNFASFFPYAELGYRRGRFTAAADIRPAGGDYTDYLTVARPIRNVLTQRVSGLEFARYNGTLLISNLTLAYRLTKDRDTQSRP